MSGPGGFPGRRAPGRVAIVGSGQVGTMLGIALTGAGPSVGVDEVLLYDRDVRTAEASLSRGAGHRLAADVAEVLSADTVILAVPVHEIVDFLESQGGEFGVGTLVVDTGSAKAVIVETMRRTVASHAHALGGHPIAGAEGPGPAAAVAGLMAGAPFVLTPVRGRDREAMERGETLAEAVGARPVEMTAEEHDAIVARTSHLPHVAAFALATAVDAFPERDRPRMDAVRSLVSSGYRGATRLAVGDPGMIAGFLQANAAEVASAIDEMVERLLAFRSALSDRGQLTELLAQGRIAREAVA